MNIKGFYFIRFIFGETIGYRSKNAPSNQYSIFQWQYFSGNPKSILKVLVGKTPHKDFKTLSQECGLQCETNGNYNKYKHWKHDSEASLKPPSRFRVAAVQAKVLFRFRTPNESIKATRKSSLNDGIKEVAEIKETMKSAREGVKSSLRQETRAARLLFGISSNWLKLKGWIK